MERMDQIAPAYAAGLYQQNQSVRSQYSQDKSPTTNQSSFEPGTSTKDQDTVSLSKHSKISANSDSPLTYQSSEEDSPDSPTNTPPSTEENLDSQELLKIQKLKRRDSEVRAHEQAHLSSAGQFASGGASFVYQRGPDGNNYAVGGEVSIDIGKESSPEATISKMNTIRRAALAPANPSAADRQIAAQASILEAQARVEIQQNTSETTNVQNSANGKEIPEQSKEDSSSTVPPMNQHSSTSRRRMMITTYQAHSSQQ